MLNKGSPQKRRSWNHLSLSQLMTLVLCSTLAVFIFFALFAYSRLADFRIILSNINENFVPEIIQSGQVYNEINVLVYLTERLAKSNNETERISSYLKLETKLKALQQKAEEQKVDPYLKLQLETLSIELSELNELISFRLGLQKLYQEKLQQLYSIYDKVMTYNHQNSANHKWVIDIVNIVTIVGRANSHSDIATIRQLTKELDTKLAQLTNQTGQQNSTVQMTLFNDLIQLLSYNNGLLNLRAELLVIEGRTRGRGSFVRNLIMDYGKGAEFHSFQTNESVVEMVAKTITLVDKQVKVTGLIAIFITLLLVGIVTIVHIRFTLRLKHLYTNVQKSLKASNADNYKIEGDEISNIAETFNLFVNEVENQNRVLRDISLSDGLTNIPNRRAFDEKLTEYLNLVRRHQWPISILLIDVDFFKNFNDHYGHVKGDKCLIEIAEILQSQMKRQGDFLARYGGEEFACILINSSQKSAEEVACNIINSMAAKKIAHDYSQVAKHITVSIGVACYKSRTANELSPEDIIIKADKALYLAKANGRNRFEVFK